MSDNKITAVIPVRAGSRRLPNKNILPFADSNLLTNKIQQLKKVKAIDEIVVSSDSDVMLNIAYSENVTAQKRPVEYCDEKSKSFNEVVEWIANNINTDILMWTPCVCPIVDSTAYENAIYAFECKNDTLASQQLLKEAAAKGSDIACILQIFLYEELDNQELYEQSLHKYADRFPVLYVKLGELSMRDDSEGHWEQAVKYYTLADNNGMLTEEGALALSSVYRMLEKEGKMKCDPKEMVRLEALANHKWK